METSETGEADFAKWVNFRVTAMTRLKKRSADAGIARGVLESCRIAR